MVFVPFKLRYYGPTFEYGSTESKYMVNPQNVHDSQVLDLVSHILTLTVDKQLEIFLLG
jgi:hypothetical protein